MSKVLLLLNPILTTSLIYPMAEVYPISIYNDQQGVLSPPMHNFFLEHEGQQLCPCCHAFMHIFPPYIPLGGWWHELIWRLSLYKLCFHGNYPGCSTTLFFLLLLVGWCSNRRLDSMYEPTKPPARVCSEIFINVRWKQIKVTTKPFFLVRWDLRLLLSLSQIYSCPYSLINFFALDLPKSALIYSECQMDCSCCLLSLWPQNRSLNYLWTFLCLGCQN